MTVAEIKQIIFNLPWDEPIALDEEISEKIAATVMMKLAETGCSEWSDPEEDIYNDEPA